MGRVEGGKFAGMGIVGAAEVSITVVDVVGAVDGSRVDVVGVDATGTEVVVLPGRYAVPLSGSTNQ